jgi:hypothetical protein
METFRCEACGKEYERDVVSTGVEECRICYRTHCKECLNEEGICVACSKLEEGKKE